MEDLSITKTRQIIIANRYLCLASCFHETPWAAPLAYVVDAEYNFYFYSAINSLHGEQIKHNPLVAFAIYDSTADSDSVDGLQIAGRAEEISRSALPRITKLYWYQSFMDEAARNRWMRPDDDFHYPAIKRFYQITPTKIYKLDLTKREVDLRIEIPLRELIKIPPHYL